MEATHVQAKSISSGTGASSIAVTLDATVGSGNLICGAVLWDGTTDTITSITDDKSNSYTKVDTQLNPQGDGRSALSFYLKNITNGPVTITVNFSGSPTYRALAVREASGCDTTAPLDQHVGSTVANPGTTANAITSTAKTPTSNGQYVAGFAFNLYDDTRASAGMLNLGTGFSSRDEATGSARFYAASEHLIQSTAASVAATFTQSATGADDYVAFLLTFKAPYSGSVALSGTATGSITESDIVAGGKTVVLTVSNDTWIVDTPTPPLIEAADATQSGSNTAQTSWAVSTPAASTGDLLIFHIAWDDSTTVTGCTAPSGKASETLTQINATPVADSAHDVRSKMWYCVCAGTWTAGTITFTPSASEQWSAHVLRVPAGEFDGTTPIGATGTNASTADDSEVDSPAFTAGSTDGYGKLLFFAGVDTDPLLTKPTGWTEIAKQDIGAVASGVCSRDTAVTNSESIASAIWPIASDAWVSQGIVVRAPSTTPFSAQRAAIRNGLDSAQSEAAGWDAKVKPNIPVGNVVRTSDTVCTITLQAQSDYDISAQETITATVPAAALAGNTQVVASPTFTVDTAGYTVVVDAASFTWTANDVTLSRTNAYQLAVDAASFVWTAADATLYKTGSYSLIVDAASFDWTANAVTLTVGRTVDVYWDDISGEDGYRVKWGTSAGTYPNSADVAADVTTYAITGLADFTTYHWIVVGLLSGTEQTPTADQVFTVGIPPLVPDAATFTWTANDVTLSQTASYTLSVDAASFAWTAADVTLSQTFAYSLTVDAASFSWTANAVGLTTQYRVIGDAASFAWTANDAGLTAQRQLAVDTASFVWTGNDVALTAQRVVAVDAASYVWTAADVGLTGTFGLAVDATAFTWTAADVDLTLETVGAYELVVDAAEFAWTAADVGFGHSYVLVVDGAAYTWTAADVGLKADYSLAVDASAYTWTAADVDLTYAPSTTAYEITIEPVAFEWVAADVLLTGPQRGGAAFVGWLLERIDEEPVRERIEEERRELAISKKASAVIAELARDQLARQVQGEITRTEELVRALEARKIGWERAYDDALAAYRQIYESVRTAAIEAAEAQRQQAELAARMAEEDEIRVTQLLLLNGDI